MSDNPNDELSDQPSDDFANFDPAAYVAKHNQEMGRHLSSDDPVNEEVRHANQGGRSRRSRLRQDDDISPDHASVGMMGGILGMFRSGENVRLYSEVIAEALPIAGRFLPIIGCALVFLCLFVCGGGYLLITALTRR